MPERGEVQIGPGSVWECPSCGLNWTSFGIWLDNDREDSPRGDMSTRPLFAVGRWRVVGREREEFLARERFASDEKHQAACDHIETQEDSYDWRGIALLTNKFLRRVIELMPGGGEDVWRNTMD